MIKEASSETLMHKKRTAGEILTFGINNEDINLATSLSEASMSNRMLATPPPSVIAAHQAVEIEPSLTDPNESSVTRFSCHQPVNPHMRQEQSRLQTFFDNLSIWENQKISTSPHEIANAGFFFMGRRDKVKCWYCNGILQGWEREDNAWEEHAKWYPLCEFLLQQKGVDYVYNVVTRFPALRRPALRNPASVDKIQRIVESNTTVGHSSQPKPGTCTIVTDPKEEQKKLALKVENEMQTSELVQQAKEMDFDENEIKSALKLQHEKTSHGFSTLTSLVESILKLNGPTIQDEEETLAASEIETVALNDFIQLPSTSDANEIERLEEARKCKVCRNNKSCMVLIPCSHLACCVECSKIVKHCPICHCYIRETIRSYVV